MSTKKVVIICTAAVLVLGAIVGCIVHFCSEKDESGYVFPLDDLDSNPVEEIWLQNGTTGEFRCFDSAEDIEWFVSRLKSLTYTKKEKIPASGGWTYGLIIDRLNGNIDRTVSASYIYESKNHSYSLVYYLSDESKTVMEEILALMPPR